MKIPESQTIPNGEYVTLQDTWRQEWEKGVQVSNLPCMLYCKLIVKLHVILIYDNNVFTFLCTCGPLQLNYFFGFLLVLID